jgi:hypothetical protein
MASGNLESFTNALMQANHHPKAGKVPNIAAKAKGKPAKSLAKKKMKKHVP